MFVLHDVSHMAAVILCLFVLNTDPWKGQKVSGQHQNRKDTSANRRLMNNTTLRWVMHKFLHNTLPDTHSISGISHSCTHLCKLKVLRRHTNCQVTYTAPCVLYSHLLNTPKWLYTNNQRLTPLEKSVLSRKTTMTEEKDVAAPTVICWSGNTVDLAAGSMRHYIIPSHVKGNQ